MYRGANTALTHRRLVYDAFGRLVRAASVEGMDETDVALYRYNGLNMRLMWQDDADADSSLESSERFYVMHDERWRPVATFRDTDSTPKEAFVWHAAGSGGAALGGTALQSGGSAGFGGASYIDSLILRDRDDYTGGTPNPMTSASDGTLEERRYFCQNWRADVVAVTKSDGTPIEYVRYSSYGEPTVYPVADLNMDGVVNSTDSALWSDLLYSTSNASVYTDTDLDWDGQDDWNSQGIDSDLFSESYNANLGLSGVGCVSSPGVASRTGYAGYQWDQTLGAYHVRYRVYLPDIGRWTRRDPAGSQESMSLLEYCASRALSSADAPGLSGARFVVPEAAADARPLTHPYQQRCASFERQNVALAGGIAVGALLACVAKTGEQAATDYDGPNDKFRHCWSSCMISKRCGGTASLAAQLIKEAHDLGGDVLRGLPPDFVDSLQDMVANSQCNAVRGLWGPSWAAPLPNLMELLSDSCEQCCTKRVGHWRAPAPQL